MNDDRTSEILPFDNDPALNPDEAAFLTRLFHADFGDIGTVLAEGSAAGIDISRLRDHCMGEQYSYHPDDADAHAYCSVTFAMRQDTSPYTEEQNRELWNLAAGGYDAGAVG